MLNLRIAQPDHLIDLGRVPELAIIEETAHGLRIGAMTTQRTIEQSALVSRCCPLLLDALRSRRPSADAQPRHDRRQPLPSRSVRGTAGGAAGTRTRHCLIASRDGRRTIAFSEFPVGYLTTQLEPHEILIRIDVPRMAGGNADGRSRNSRGVPPISPSFRWRRWSRWTGTEA